MQVYPGWKNVHSTNTLDRLVVSIKASRSMFLPSVETNAMSCDVYLAMGTMQEVIRRRYSLMIICVIIDP